LYLAGIERRCDMRDVNIQPQSWTVDDEDLDTAKELDQAKQAKPTTQALSFSYARI
jgi:hypothetical protein